MVDFPCRWLILCAWGAHTEIISEHVCESVSEWEEDLNQLCFLSSLGWVSSNLLRSPVEKQPEKGGIQLRSPAVSLGPLIPSSPPFSWVPCCLSDGPQLLWSFELSKLNPWLSWVSGLFQGWDFSVSVISQPILHGPYFYTHIFPIGSFSSGQCWSMLMINNNVNYC